MGQIQRTTWASEEDIMMSVRTYDLVTRMRTAFERMVSERMPKRHWLYPVIFLPLVLAPWAYLLYVVIAQPH